MSISYRRLVVFVEFRKDLCTSNFIFKFNLAFSQNVSFIIVIKSNYLINSHTLWMIFYAAAFARCIDRRTFTALLLCSIMLCRIRYDMKQFDRTGLSSVPNSLYESIRPLLQKNHNLNNCYISFTGKTYNLL